MIGFRNIDNQLSMFENQVFNIAPLFKNAKGLNGFLFDTRLGSMVKNN
jgi:hypothetical protein